MGHRTPVQPHLHLNNHARHSPIPNKPCSAVSGKITTLGRTLSIPTPLGSHSVTKAGFTGTALWLAEGHLPPSLAVLLGHGSGPRQGLTGAGRWRLRLLCQGNCQSLGFLLELVQLLQKGPSGSERRGCPCGAWCPQAHLLPGCQFCLALTYLSLCPGHRLPYSWETSLVVTAAGLMQQPQTPRSSGVSPSVAETTAVGSGLDTGSSRTPRGFRVPLHIVGQTLAQYLSGGGRHTLQARHGLCSDSPSVLPQIRRGTHRHSSTLPQGSSAQTLAKDGSLQEGSESPSPGSRRKFCTEHRARAHTQSICRASDGRSTIPGGVHQGWPRCTD